MKANNMREMRDALERLLDWVDKHTGIYSIRVSPVKDDPNAVRKEKEDVEAMARTALAAPPRNCDVGTAEEQEDRFFDFCKVHECTINCPIKKKWNFKCGHKSSCAVLFSQMPYEAKEGGARWEAK